MRELATLAPHCVRCSAGVTNAIGTLTSQQRYLPFGGVRTDLPTPEYRISDTDYGYTGQRELGMGLMDYKARFYSPGLGRFNQPDSIVPNAANPQSLNRYGYVRNNPINFSDPTGHKDCSDVDANGNCITYDDEPIIDDPGGGEPPIPEWDPDFADSTSEDDKKLAEATYRDFLKNPEKYANYYLNPSNAPAEYYYLYLFVQYSELNKKFNTADDIIWLVIAEKYGQETAEAMSDAQLRNIQANLINNSSNQRTETIVIISAITVTFGHGANHLKSYGLQEATVNLMIDQQIQNIVKTQEVGGPFWGTIEIDGYTIDYRAYPLDKNHINVGTYTVRR